MDRIKSLEAFVRVADLTSFSKAADSLGSSRATVTRLILELEDELNVRLLNRTTRSVSLTSDGERIYEQARQALGAMDAVFAKNDGTGVLKGTLRVACIVAFADFFLAQALEEFAALHPDLTIELMASDAIVPLVESRIDIAFEAALTPRIGTVSKYIDSCASTLVASPEYVKNYGVPTTPDELSEHRLIALFSQTYWTLAKDIRTKRIPVKARLRYSTSPLMRDACLRGHGIACLPTIAVDQHIRNGELTAILPDWNLPVMGIYALFPTDRMIGRAAQSLYDFAAAKLIEQNATL